MTADVPDCSIAECVLSPMDCFPFPASYVRVEAGRMAYTDLGNGPPIVCLHGNPTWAVMYRHLLRDLAPSYRCIAPDYLGFGRSDKPTGASYRAPHQAARIEALLNHLNLDDVTLIVHDWGGPIGLSYALRYPERVSRLVLMNTWLWPHDTDPWMGAFSRLAGGRVARPLVRQFNAFARLALRLGTHRPVPEAVRAAYLRPLDSPERRLPTWLLARSLLTETKWLRSLWSRRRRLRSMDAVVVWGRRDPALGAARYLNRWRRLLPDARIHETQASHFVPEDLGAALAGYVRGILPRL